MSKRHSAKENKSSSSTGTGPAGQAVAAEFDQEFRRYVPQAGTSKAAMATAAARAELQQHLQILAADQMQKNKNQKLSEDKRAHHQRRVTELNAALDKFHTDIASVRIHTALMTTAGLAFALLCWYYQPWKYLNL